MEYKVVWGPWKFVALSTSRNENLKNYIIDIRIKWQWKFIRTYWDSKSREDAELLSVICTQYKSTDMIWTYSEMCPLCLHISFCLFSLIYSLVAVSLSLCCFGYIGLLTIWWKQKINPHFITYCFFYIEHFSPRDIISLFKCYIKSLLKCLNDQT